MALILKTPADSDAEAVADLVNAADAAETGVGGDFTSDEMRHEWATPGFTLETDAWLAYDGDDLVGYACTFDEHRSPQITLDLYVRPGAGPAVGLSLVERATRRAVELGRGRGRLTLRLGQTAGTPLARALPDAGWAPVRHFYRMQRPATDGDTSVVVAPLGVAMHAAWDETDARALHAVIEEAFAEHWGHQPAAYEDWLERTEAAHKDRDLWWLVTLDGHPVGGMLGKPESEGLGWVSYLAVVPEARGRGVAKYILRRAFAEFARRGRPGVGLTVDTANATGALDLYLAVGMHATYEIVAWDKPVP